MEGILVETNQDLVLEMDCMLFETYLNQVFRDWWHNLWDLLSSRWMSYSLRFSLYYKWRSCLNLPQFCPRDGRHTRWPPRCTPWPPWRGPVCGGEERVPCGTSPGPHAVPPLSSSWAVLGLSMSLTGRMTLTHDGQTVDRPTYKQTY